MKLFNLLSLIFSLFVLFSCSNSAEREEQKPLQISGVYPHLAVFNDKDRIPCQNDGDECGIGAVIPWAGKLWMLTYSPHCPGGSSDLLYSIDEDYNLEIRQESIGGTPANRFIHKESNQLIIGPYFIDASGKIRAVPYQDMPARHTATARHLTKPEEWVYFQDMEGSLYEVNVHSLKVNRLFEKPVPGWHAKGAYTSQGRYVMANNGEHQVFDISPDVLQAGAAPLNDEEMGCLAEWDGSEWRIVERKQFTDVTGPGGVYGAQSDDEPIWSMGWDKRSVLLKLLDQGVWYTYRLPKGTRTYDHWGGWYTEWPRIREIGSEKMLMDMHGTLFDFPRTFSAENTSGIKPISTHLRYIPDFCEWNGQLVISTDETSIMHNDFAGRSQSNLWFGDYEDLKNWGPKSGWGGVWMNDVVQQDAPSVPFLIKGYTDRVLHLGHQNRSAVIFSLEVDKSGKGDWELYRKIEVGTKGYGFHILPADLDAWWMRIRTDKTGVATAYFHFSQAKHTESDTKLFRGLASTEVDTPIIGMIRPARHNRSLQWLQQDGGNGKYYELDEELQFSEPETSRKDEVEEICKLEKEFEVDELSVIIEDKGGKFRVPKGDLVFDQPFTIGWPRGKREIESERSMFNLHGTFYEFPREAGLIAMKPVATHNRLISDFCTWRGLLVMSGVDPMANEDGHVFKSPDGQSALWFGAVDDLWSLGKPVGEGGVWKNTKVKSGERSLPYLMTGYNRKHLTLVTDKSVDISVEITFDLENWHLYDLFTLYAGEEVEHDFPEGFSAHWIRFSANKDCSATAWLIYE